MEALIAALDALADEDLGAMFGPPLLDRLRPLLVAQNRLAAEIARTVRDCEVSGAAEIDGLEVMTSWLRGHGHYSAAEAARVVRAGRALEDTDGPEPDPTEGRRLVLVRHADGSGTGRFDLDAVGLEKLQTALESIVLAGRCAGDDRSHAQQQADALVQLCDNALASGSLPVLRGHKPQVIVKMGIEDLADPAPTPGAADLGSGAIISAARARWLACDGRITRIVLGPDGLPLDVGRSMRLVPPHIRRAAEVRDGGCVFAGCAAPTGWCDVHHLLEWINGGQTNLDNSALLCERHHTKVHHGFRVERQPDGRWRTWRPDGTQIRTGPLLDAAA